MPAGPQPFGATADGAPVWRTRLAAHGLTADILSWGAVLQDLRLAGTAHPLVLGFPTLAAYEQAPGCLGAIVGRLANRIAGGRAPIAGRAHAFDRNEAGRTTLHGGREGTGTRPWRIEAWSESALTLALTLADGHMGFPGRLDIRATYALAEGPALSLDIEAGTDAETLCGLAPHSYFNLDGRADIAGHSLRIAAETMLPVDDDAIPTGEIRPVAGTAFDFRTARAIPAAAPGIDHNFCLAEARGALRPVATLRAGGLAMTLETTEPGLQVYTAATLDTSAHPGLTGRPYGPFAGIALEPQCWPDAPNQAWAAQAGLAPAAHYRQRSVFRFAEAPPP